MIPYFIFLFFIFFFYYKGNYKGMMVILTLFSVLRYNVGWDYSGYYELALSPESYHDYYRFSVFWKIILMFAYNHHCPTFAIWFPSLLICISTFWGIYLMLNGDKKKICDALIIYALWPFFYLSTFSTIRQWLAISICLLIFASLKRKWYIFGGLLYLFNFFIHPSSLISILVFPLFIWNCQLNIKTSFIIVVVGILVFKALSSIIALISLYGNYVESGADFGGTLQYLLIMISLWLIYSMFISQIHAKSIPYIGVVAVSFFWEAAIYMMGLSSVVARSLSYFSILFIFVVMDSVRILSPKLTRMVLLLFAALFIWYLNHSIEANATTGYIPYKTLIFR